MGPSRRGSSIDELLDCAVAAINRGDRAVAAELAGQVLAVDAANIDAGDLLAAPGDVGEIRRLTIVFADLDNSTKLSSQVEPETYRLLVGRYRELVLQIVDRFGGYVGSKKGESFLAVFGYPQAHDNDALRAVAAALEITREITKLNEQAQRRFEVEVAVRVGVHRGLVYLDTAQNDVYGLAANLAARVSGLAPPGAVVISDSVAPLVGDAFDLAALPPTSVKGVDELIAHHRVLGERAGPTRVRRDQRAPMIGRDREQARLVKSWARAQAGTLTTPGVVFRGEPGIGKSRLVSAAAEHVERSGGVVLELVGSPLHVDAGLHPVRTLLEHRCGISRLTEPTERLQLLETEVRARSLDPATIVPLLAPVLGIAAKHGYAQVPAEGRKLYDLIADAVGEYLLACVGAGAGLIVAEDTQWFDPSTLEILGSLLARGGGRLLVVVAGRNGPWLPASWPVRLFDLAPLTNEQSDALIAALDPTLGPADRRAVRNRCDGVPFYIEQVIDGLSDAGVPEALYESLFARLSSSVNAVPVVEAAGVIGRHVDRSLLGAVCTLDADDLDDVIDALEDAMVLEPCGTDSWRFCHELLREVAYELAPPTVRQALHAKVANALVQGVGTEPDWRLVAGHYEQALRFDEAASAYRQASDAARRRGALGEARAYVNLAIAQLERAKPGRDRDRREIAARLERGFLAGAAEGHSSPAAAADFERCLQLAGTDLQYDELVATLAALMGYYTVRADVRRADEVGRVLRAGLGHHRDWFRPAVEAISGVVAVLRGDFEAARSHLEQATAGDAAAQHPLMDSVWFLPNEPIASAHFNLALADLVRGDLAGAEAELARTVHRVEQLGFPQGPYSRGYALFVETWMRIEAGQLDHAAALNTELINQAERYGFDQWQLVGDTQQAIVGALASLLGAEEGDPADLSAHFASIINRIDALRAVGLNVYGTSFDASLGRLLIAADQLEWARTRLDSALQWADETGMHFYDAELVRLRAQTSADTHGRQADISAAVALAREQGATLFELRAALDDAELRGEPALAALNEVAERFPGTDMWPEFVRAQAFLARTHPKAGQPDPVR